MNFFKLLLLALMLLLFNGCTKTNSNDENNSTQTKQTDKKKKKPISPSTETNTTIILAYSKGPVDGATAILLDASGNMVAGPVTTTNGQASFIGVTYSGLVYAQFSGGSYVDEATNTSVTLPSSFVMHSGVVNNSGSGTLQLTASPLTEIGFQRAQSSADPINTINSEIENVANTVGLKGINLTTTAPRSLYDINSTSDSDLYGTVLAAVSQQLYDSNLTADSTSLQSFIQTSLPAINTFTLEKALNNLQTNSNTLNNINSTTVQTLQKQINHPNSFSISGTVSGLTTGSVTLQLNAQETLSLTPNQSTFIFNTELNSSEGYVVTIKKKDNNLTCSLSNASGVMSNANITTIQLTCLGSNLIKSKVKLIAKDTAAGDNFGQSVAISGDYIVVGAPYNDDPELASGSAYLFKRNADRSVTQLAKLTASDGVPGDLFGSSVAISGDYIVVGVLNDSDAGYQSGSAYLFKRHADGNVTELAKLTASDATADDWFGYSIAINGDYIIVGALYASDAKYRSGSAYLFKRHSDSNVTQLTKLTATDAATYDDFAYSVAIDGDYIVVGAKSDDENAGSTYLFKRNTDSNVTQLAKLNASDATTNNFFGSSVAISGNYIVVGAPYNDDPELASGSAYLFKRNADSSVTQLAKLTASDGVPGDHFGHSVSISGDYIVIGAPQTSDAGTWTGSTYLFKCNSDSNVTEQTKLVASDAEAFDLFGRSVAISGEYFVVGAYTFKEGTGSAYINGIFYDDASDQIDSDGDGVDDNSDAFPLDATEWIDTDGDDIGNNADTDDDNDGYLDTEDAFALDATEWIDTDGDGIGNNADTDDDNDGYLDTSDAFPLNASEWTDSDGDGVGDNADAYPLDATKSSNPTKIDVKAIASDAEVHDKFGSSVAISGDYMVIGAPGDRVPADNADGSAYLYKRNADSTVTLLAKFTATDAVAYNDFGRSVAIDGNYIVVGCKGHYAFLFKRNTDTSITQLAKLTASDDESGKRFGNSVSISGNYIVVGAFQDNDAGDRSGSTYLFKRNADNNVTQLAKLTASDAAADVYFGTTVSISGDYIVVGAPSESEKGSNSGSAYLFKRHEDNNVTEIAKLTASDGEAGDFFGESVSISSNYIVVGAASDSKAEEHSGSAYLFERNADNNITQLAILTASDAEPYDYFGTSVAISGDYIIIGAKNDDDVGYGSNSGSAYLFKRHADNSVTELAKLTALDAAKYDYFGESVAISGNHIVIGANHKKNKTGSAYLKTTLP